MTQQTAEFDTVAHGLANGRDKSNGGGFLINHADGSLICDDA